MTYPVSIFGVQTGGELLARIRYLYDSRSVDDATADLVYNMTVPQAAAVLAASCPHLRLVDVNEPVGFLYRDELYDDSVGMFEAVFISRVQPAASVTIIKPAEEMHMFIHDMHKSGMYECHSLLPVGSI